MTAHATTTQDHSMANTRKTPRNVLSGERALKNTPMGTQVAQLAKDSQLTT